jgi:assimilatory nitrate reductase catalytic subunit
MGSIKTTCPYCGVGCGIVAQVESNRVIAVSGDPQHPANAGRLCVKGAALAETMSTRGRLLFPESRGQRLDWDVALDTVAHRLRSTAEAFGPDSIAFYLSGQLLTEDYYVANKLMKGFLGSANVDTNSRLCMSSAVAAYKRAFGEDIVPCSYEDLEHCDLLVMVGSNAAWTHPVLYQRIVASKARNPDKKIVVVDTRETATCDIADLHLQIKPGSDAFLFVGLLQYLYEHQRLDDHYIRHCTEGLQQTVSAIGDLREATVLLETGLSQEQLTLFYRWFADTERAVTFYSQGINQSSSGTDKCNAIINVHLATGRLGRRGMGPFSITGQPNAMGGREVGGLANQLAAHMDFDATSVNRVKRFWGATDMATAPGLKAVDMFRKMDQGKIKFIWIMATNPAVSLPDSALVRRALERCEFVVVSDCVAQTDTSAFADILLPAAGWGEKSGSVTNSERVISRQRSLVTAPGEAKPDWWIVTQVAKRLGFGNAFSYAGPADIFREHAALSAFENDGGRMFDLGALQDLEDDAYAALAPTPWPARAPETLQESAPPEQEGGLPGLATRARFVPVIPQAMSAPQAMTLNTGRLRDQWHTMTRTGVVPRLSQHSDFFGVHLARCDAQRLGLDEDQLVQVSNALGTVRGILRVDDGLPAGQVYLPIHWSDRFTAQGTACSLIPSTVDPVSGQPQLKFAGVDVSAVPARAWGLVFTRNEPQAGPFDYWSRISVDGGYVSLLADCAGSDALLAKVSPVLNKNATASFDDAARGDHRRIACDNRGLSSAVFIAANRQGLPAPGWIARIGRSPVDIAALLSGIDCSQPDTGPMVCSCWEVGEKQICAALEQGETSLQGLGERLRCGTRCGSCIPELKRLLARQARTHAA